MDGLVSQYLHFKSCLLQEMSSLVSPYFPWLVVLAKVTLIDCWEVPLHDITSSSQRGLQIPVVSLSPFILPILGPFYPSPQPSSPHTKEIYILFSLHSEIHVLTQHHHPLSTACYLPFLGLWGVPWLSKKFT